MKFSHALVQDLVSEQAWPSVPPMGKAKQPITHRPSAWGKPPASATTEAGGLAEALGRWVIIGANLAPANQAPPVTAVMTWSPAPTSTTSLSQVTTTGRAAAAADLDPLPKPQQPAQEAVPVPDVPTTTHEDAKEESDAGEVTSQKSDEKMEDKHEKKTESNHQETQDGGRNASASESQDQDPSPCQESGLGSQEG